MLSGRYCWKIYCFTDVKASQVAMQIDMVIKIINDRDYVREEESTFIS